jgi:hypothetical protein
MSAPLKRLEDMERAVRFRRLRTITVRIPTLLTPVAGSVEMDATVEPEVRAKADEMLEAIRVTDADTIVELALFYEAPKTNGGTEPEQIPDPEILGIT